MSLKSYRNSQSLTKFLYFFKKNKYNIVKLKRCKTEREDKKMRNNSKLFFSKTRANKFVAQLRNNKAKDIIVVSE